MKVVTNTIKITLVIRNNKFGFLILSTLHTNHFSDMYTIDCTLN